MIIIMHLVLKRTYLWMYHLNEYDVDKFLEDSHYMYNLI
jgi:hypothetical protein